ncbi:hypothetical protein [Pseudoxanthomonas sp. J35]|uniref:hypothetical protein n=1 Tax=Pseudoxanthomonas sp. J35 TaxID=935852 RepID=UPI0004906B98|nr:hypothetical protein [Pseudoxanthomonas sp. J35]
MHTLRWLLLLPAIICAWSLVLVLGVGACAFVNAQLCPPQELVSGLCGNATIRTVLAWLQHVAAAASALAVLATAVAIAPARKQATLWTTLVAGLGIATALAFVTEQWLLSAAAALGGIAGAALIAGRLRRRADANTPHGP